jgi:hypothetical protein
VKRASQLVFGLPMLALWPFLERRRSTKAAAWI